MRFNIKIIFGFIIIIILFVGKISLEAKSINEYVSIDNEEILFEIGKMIYNQPGDGCTSCHGTDGMGGVSKENNETKENYIANLNDPNSWTSYKITKKFTSDDNEILTQKFVAISLIRLGALDWNENFSPLIRDYTGSNYVFFDEQMIGIHSKYLKKNAKSSVRRLKRQRVKFKPKDIMDIMANSVFHYIEKTFIKKD